MKTKKYVACFLAVLCIIPLIASCFGSTEKSKHAPLTILTARKDYTEFAKAFKEAYPEVELQFISYDGENATYYTHKLLEVGQAPDIYTSGVLPDAELQKKGLIDLSVYDFSAKYAVSRLNECGVEGAIYLLPCNYSVLGIYYNKTLFEKHGWKAPESFRELEALVPQIRAANVDLCATEMEYTGSGFQYLFNLGDTVFLRTPEGCEWVEQFLNGEVTADNVWDATLAYMQKWIDLGMIDGTWSGKTTDEAQSHFMEGNTAFYIHSGPFRFAQNEDGTGDRYGIIPWLSEDGSGNRFITNTSCYFGLNADLEKPENKQKLEDALKLMAFISTEEGQRLLPGGKKQLLPLLEQGEDAADEYREVIALLNAGFSAPFAYAGWEDLIVPVGTECLKWYAGNSTGEQVIAVMNRALQDSLADKTNAYGQIAENLTLEETARLVGTAFLEAAEADCSLISLGAFHDGKENRFGANGCLWIGPATDEAISSINPLGWVDTIKTATLTGKQIRQLAETGFDLFGDGDPFPYVLTIRENTDLTETQEYTVVLCGYTEDLPVRDTQICGMDALRAYFTKIGTVTKETVSK